MVAASATAILDDIIFHSLRFRFMRPARALKSQRKPCKTPGLPPVLPKHFRPLALTEWLP